MQLGSWSFKKLRASCQPGKSWLSPGSSVPAAPCFLLAGCLASPHTNPAHRQAAPRRSPLSRAPGAWHGGAEAWCLIPRSGLHCKSFARRTQGPPASSTSGCAGHEGEPGAEAKQEAVRLSQLHCAGSVGSPPHSMRQDGASRSPKEAAGCNATRGLSTPVSVWLLGSGFRVRQTAWWAYSVEKTGSAQEQGSQQRCLLGTKPSAQEALRSLQIHRTAPGLLGECVSVPGHRLPAGRALPEAELCVQGQFLCSRAELQTAVMGPGLRAPRLCWASWLLGVLSFISVWSYSARVSGDHGAGIQDSAAPILVKGIRGGSVLLQVTQWPGKDLGAMVEDITWVFFSGSEHTGILRVYNRTVDPTLLKLQDKYKGRVQTPSVTSLEIRNLSPQDSGQYMAQGWLMTGEDLHQVFDLKVYEPVSPPQILAKSLSVTAEWCNVTLECRPTGATEDLNVTWENKGLARELEQRGTPGPAPTPWTRAVSLPLSQANGSLSCVVSNPADQNRATSDLSDICPRGGSGQSTAGLTGGLLGGFVAVILLLGAGLYLWKLREKRKKMVLEQCSDSGAGLQQDQRVCTDDVLYAGIMTQNPLEESDKRIGEQHPEARGPLTSVYSKLVLPGQPMKIT